jgi:hypothetical protein
VLKGEVQPDDVGERLALAGLCQLPCKSLYAASARFYTAAFAAAPQLNGAQPSEHRYNAACTAALAGCGQGKDVEGLAEEEAVHLRRLSLDWLRSELDSWRATLDKQPDKARPAVAQKMRHWLRDPDFSGVRGADALAKLPEAERQQWQKLWDDVAETLRRAADRPPQSKEGDKKP